MFSCRLIALSETDRGKQISAQNYDPQGAEESKRPVPSDFLRCLMRSLSYRLVMSVANQLAG